MRVESALVCTSVSSLVLQHYGNQEMRNNPNNRNIYLFIYVLNTITLHWRLKFLKKNVKM
jgi:hypothetical protein